MVIGITFTVTFHVRYTSNSGWFAFFSAIFLSALNCFVTCYTNVSQQTYSFSNSDMFMAWFGSVCYTLLDPEY
jgi:hypothetical protein